jgi:ureidoglycolate hydrolase
MKTIAAQPLTPEAFRKYGVYQNLLDDEAVGAFSPFSKNAGFCPDLLTLNFGTSTLPSISVCRVQKTERNIVSFLEAHQYTCEGLIPLDGDVIIFVGMPARGRLSADHLEAFLVPKGTFVKLEPHIIHGTQYPLSDGITHLICMLPERTFKNDMIAQRLEEDDERVEIIVP